MIQAAENWTDTLKERGFSFSTTANGTTTPAIRMTLDSTGNLGLGTQRRRQPWMWSGKETKPCLLFDDVTRREQTERDTGFMTRTARGTVAAPAAVQTG